MTLPTYDELIAPLLKYLAGQTEPVRAKQAYEDALLVIQPIRAVPIGRDSRLTKRGNPADVQIRQR